MIFNGHIFEGKDFFHFLDLEIKRARRYQNMFGVLRFELHNSSEKGRGGREKNVKFLVRLLRDEIRETDVLGRTEKDEIMVILPYCDQTGLKVVYSRLDSLVRDFHVEDHDFNVTSCFVCFPTEGTDIEEILDNLRHDRRGPAPASSPATDF